MGNAIEHLQKAIKINPDFAEAHYKLAGLFDEKNDYKSAKKHYLKSIDLKKDFDEAFFKLATMLKRKKHPFLFKFGSFGYFSKLCLPHLAST